MTYPVLKRYHIGEEVASWARLNNYIREKFDVPLPKSFMEKHGPEFWSIWRPAGLIEVFNVVEITGDPGTGASRDVVGDEYVVARFNGAVAAATFRMWAKIKPY